MSASSSSSSLSSGISSCVYDVFLSFSGIDTRNNFTSHLLAALNRQGFSTFRDDTKLKSGEDIRSQLPTAILESRVSIVVFSKNYAASGWCLDELVKIMDCRRDLGQIVLPIFYDVSPSDVRTQRGYYAEAFEKHEHRFKGTSSSSSMERLLRWREALADAANLSGWDLKNLFNGDEAKLIKIVIEEVTNRLDQEYSSVADHPVGVDSRLRPLKLMLKLGLDDVRIVAVWGVGGIGKTTLARDLFNSVRRDFQCSSFLADISQTSKLSGVVVLQTQLLSDILVNETYNLNNYHHGIEVIRRKLYHKKVLLVLDDVDNVQQLEMLAINRDLFFKGSKIIITTRNMSSLMSIQPDSVYSPEELNDTESLKLFSWNAFKTDHPEEGYGELSHEVLMYADGLPLALKVFGSFLFGRSKAEWQSGLRKLRKHPHSDIQGKLKISFDSLDKNNQELLLDIAFFSIGRDKIFTVKVIEEDSDNFPEIGIGELARRCLVRVDEHNKLRMHNLIRDMAREIVCQESFKEPGERSRLGGHEEVLQVLRDCTGTKAIEGLHLELPELNDEHVNVAAFANMRNLRLLRLDYLCHIRGNYVTISKKLKWLCWHQFPLPCLPADLYMENLVAIDLQYSRLKQLWKGPKRLDKLRFLNLSYSHCLTKTPCFSGLKNLEELLLNDCTNLVKVHNSIGCLDKLVKLNLGNCQNLRMIPSSISMLKSLEYLNLCGCSKLGDLARFKGPVSMFRKLLTKPQVCGISAAAIQGLSCLQDLDLSDCNMSYVPSEIGSLMLLQTLNLNGNKFCSLPSSLSNLCHLEHLFLTWCDKLRLLSDLPRSLTALWANRCNSLEPESVGALLGKVKLMSFARCHQLDDNNFRRSIIQSYQGDFVTSLVLTGSELPDDFHFQGTGSNLSFVVPAHFHQKIKGWIACALIDDIIGINYVRYEVINKSKGSTTLYPRLEDRVARSWVTTDDGTYVVLPWHVIVGRGCMMWVNYVRLSEDEFNNIEEGDEMEIVYFCEFWSPIRDCIENVKKCGIRLIYEDDHKGMELNKQLTCVL